MVELRKAGGEFAGARAWGRNDYKGSCGLDVWVGTVAFVGYDCVDIGWVAFGESMEVGFYVVIL